MSLSIYNVSLLVIRYLTLSQEECEVSSGTSWIELYLEVYQGIVDAGHVRAVRSLWESDQISRIMGSLLVCFLHFSIQLYIDFSATKMMYESFCITLTLHESTEVHKKVEM